MITVCPRGDLNPEISEISLNLSLNSKTGEKSPDGGVHTRHSSGPTVARVKRAGAATRGFQPEPERHEPMRRHTEIARVAVDSHATKGCWMAETCVRYALSA